MFSLNNNKGKEHNQIERKTSSYCYTHAGGTYGNWC